MFEQDEQLLKEYNQVIRDNIFHFMKLKGINTINQLSVKTKLQKHVLYKITSPNPIGNLRTNTILRLERFFEIGKGELLKQHDKKNTP